MIQVVLLNKTQQSQYHTFLPSVCHNSEAGFVFCVEKNKKEFCAQFIRRKRKKNNKQLKHNGNKKTFELI